MRVFNETQHFTQWWLQLINLFILGFVIYAIYSWSFLNKAVGNVTAEDLTGHITVIVIMLIVAALIYLFRLKTTIDETGVHYQFIPINNSKKTIRWAELKKCYVRTYGPIEEFGGWGYRGLSGKNKAVNVKGNKGIQLEFKDGKTLLIGTQKEEDVQKVIERYFKINDE